MSRSATRKRKNPGEEAADDAADLALGAPSSRRPASPATRFCMGVDILLAAKEQEFAEATGVCGGRDSWTAWSSSAYRDVLRKLIAGDLQHELVKGAASERHLISKLLAAGHGGGNAGQIAQLRQGALELLEQPRLGQQHEELQKALDLFETDTSVQAPMRRHIVRDFSLLLQKEAEANDFAAAAHRIADISSRVASSRSCQPVGAAHGVASLAARRAKTQRQLAEGEGIGGANGFRTGQELMRTANGGGDRAPAAARQYELLQTDAEDAGGTLDGPAPGRCRSMVLMLQVLSELPTLAQPPAQCSFDPQNMVYRLPFRVPSLDAEGALDSSLLRGISRVKLSFDNGKGGLADAADLSSRATRFAEYMLSCMLSGKPLTGGGATAGHATKGGAGVAWFDVNSTGNLGLAAKRGATVKTLTAVREFESVHKLPELWLLATRATMDDGTQVRISAQPPVGRDDEPPVLHMDSSVAEVNGGLDKADEGGLGDVLVRFAANWAGGRSFLLAADKTGGYVAELLREAGCGAVAMHPTAYAVPDGKRTEGARVFHAAAPGDSIGMTVIITVRDRGQGYADLPERLAALGLTVTPL